MHEINSNINIEVDKKICSKCGVKEDKFFMDESANGMFICKDWIFCEQRHSQLVNYDKY